MTCVNFDRYRKTAKILFFAFRIFFKKSSLQNQKSPFTVKFSPCSSLEVTFFALLCFVEI